VDAVGTALADLPAGVPIVLAMSGGPDSAALAVAVGRARPDLLARAVHVRHGLRDDAADVAAVTAQTAALGLDLEVVEVEVRAAGEGLAAAARAARYAVLAGAARPDGAVLLVGHTADDQAETVLLNLGRGTGTAGLGGMRAVTTRDGVALHRPLLGVRRRCARRLAAELPTVDDPSNVDPDRRRWRVRAHVLPALAGLSGGPGDPVGLLCRLADLARADADALDALATREAERLVIAWGPARVVSVADLGLLPPALATRVVRGLLAAVRGGAAGLPSAAVEAAVTLSSGGQIDVAGSVRVTCGQGWLAAAPAGGPGLPPRPVGPRGAAVPELGLVLRVGEHPAAMRVPPGMRRPAGATTASAPQPPVGATLRGWGPGDRVEVRGRSCRVAALLAAAGVPRAVRPLVPVLTDARGRCVWVPGVAAGPAARPGSSEVGACQIWLADAAPTAGHGGKL
jgi:tRNA(Ile)-lysidine synthase